MDYKIYENSKMLLEQSGNQQLSFLKVECKIEIYKFLRSKGVQPIITNQSKEELAYQAYAPNLFTGTHIVNDMNANNTCHDRTSKTYADNNNSQEYVLSSVNGSLTSKQLDADGYPIKEIVESNGQAQSITQPLLWDATPRLQRLNRDKKGVDIFNIYAVRNLEQQKKKFFCLLNDQDQINQLQLEGYKYLRPTDFLAWMVQDRFIALQKAVWSYKKMAKHDSRWIKKGGRFKDIYNKQ